MTETSALAVEGSRYGPEYYSSTEAAVAASRSWYDGVDNSERQMLNATNDTMQSSDKSNKRKFYGYM